MTLDNHTLHLLEAAAEVTRLVARIGIERPEYHRGRNDATAALIIARDLAALVEALPPLDDAVGRLHTYAASILASRGEDA